MANEIDEADLTPQGLSAKIEKVKLDLEAKYIDLQTQLNKLGVRSDANDDKQNTQIIRVAVLIDTAMDNIKSIIGMLVEINTKLAEQDQQLWSHGNSISINKRNLSELSKYIKKADKAWKDARKEIDALQVASDEHATFHGKISWAFTILAGAVIWLVTGDHAKVLWDWICNLFSGSGS